MRYFFFLCLIVTLSLKSNEEVIKLIEKYERPITLLDLNAGDGRVSISLAEKFPASTIVMMEQNQGLGKKNAYDLFQNLRRNSHLKNTILLNNTLTYNDLLYLSKNEHIDLIVAINVLNQIRIPRNVSKETIMELLINSTNELVVNLPENDDEYERILKEKYEYKTLYLNDEMQVYHIESECLKRNREEVLKRLPLSYESESGLSILRCQRPTGISLVTYLLFRGIWPSKEFIFNKLSNIEWSSLANMDPSKIRIQGDLIEFETLALPTKEKEGEKSKEFCLNLFDCQTKRAIREYLKKD